MKRIFSFLLISILLFTQMISVSAEEVSSPKEEVIYGLLDLDGSLKDLYVVNIFEGGSITDYGNYSNIRNMTTSEKIHQDGDCITINTNADKFYYQGTLEAQELPWDISIKYFLDGKEISGSELGGKSGRLKMTMSVKKNHGIPSHFFDSFALQIGMTLDNKQCSNITTDNATIAEAGSKKQLTYTLLPGTGLDTAVTADVRDFEMDPITINGIRLSLDIDVDTDEFTKQITELTEAIEGLDKGAAELLEGLHQLSKGTQKYMEGMQAFKNGLVKLSDGVDKLNTGATALSSGLSQLTKQNDSLIQGALAIQKSTFDAVNAQLGEMGLGLPVLTAENYVDVLSSIPHLAEVKSQLDGVVQFTDGLKGYMDGVAQIGVGALELASGTSEFQYSSSVIASSANELYNAGVELNGGIKELRDGFVSYKKGTKQLRDGTKSMDSEINKKMDEMLGSISGFDDPFISFVSEKNTDISAVQFVLKTDPIQPPETPKAVDSKPEELSFWQKILKLLGLSDK